MGTLRLEQMEDWRKRKEKKRKKLSKWTKRKRERMEKKYIYIHMKQRQCSSLIEKLNLCLPLFPSLILTQSSTCRLKDRNTIDWSSKRWECVTGSASHHKTNDPGPFAYIHTKRNRVCLCNDEFRARVYIHITVALPFNHLSHFSSSSSSSSFFLYRIY